MLPATWADLDGFGLYILTWQRTGKGTEGTHFKDLGGLVVFLRAGMLVWVAGIEAWWCHMATYVWVNISWWHQAITWTSVDLYSKVFCGIHLRATSQKYLWQLISKTGCDMFGAYTFDTHRKIKTDSGKDYVIWVIHYHYYHHGYCYGHHHHHHHHYLFIYKWDISVFFILWNLKAVPVQYGSICLHPRRLLHWLWVSGRDYTGIQVYYMDVMLGGTSLISLASPLVS